MFYQQAFSILVLGLLLACIGAVAVWAYGHWLKVGTETVISLGVQTGDAESMNLSANLKRGQTQEERLAVAQGLYDVVGKRRKDNHEAFEKIKRDAIAAKEAEMAAEDAKKLKLAPGSEAAKKGS
jgi:hypothetical protein